MRVEGRGEGIQVMKPINGPTLVLALLAAIAAPAVAQDTAPRDPLLTRPGWEVGGQVSKYNYEEPDFMQLEGERIGVIGAYSFTTPNLVYGRIDGRVSYGKLDYESVGTGTSSDVPDWIAEVRGVIGRDYRVGERTALSPYIGLGYRYLYNDLRGYSSTGAVGYRRYSEYWYVPIGLTMRMRTGAQWVFAPTVEYDAFIGGKQTSKLSDTGLGFNDATNRQDEGRGYRVYLMLEGERWAFGPWLHYWNIKDSDVVPIGGGFGGLEPANWTREYGLELRYRF
jgi:outer membrane protein with beta-barrel domain